MAQQNIYLLKNASPQELSEIKRIAGEAFADDHIFDAFGTGAHRYRLVHTYMNCYVDYAYRSKILYTNSELTGAVALLQSGREKTFPTIRLLHQLKKNIPANEYERFMDYSAQVSSMQDRWHHMDYLEMLMLCVEPKLQGQGIGRQFMEFAKQQCRKLERIMIIDTDMPNNCQIYQHMGAQLIDTKQGSNGNTRYNLVWRA